MRTIIISPKKSTLLWCAQRHPNWTAPLSRRYARKIVEIGADSPSADGNYDDLPNHGKQVSKWHRLAKLHVDLAFRRRQVELSGRSEGYIVYHEATMSNTTSNDSQLQLEKGSLTISEKSK
ncbi:hypothetical protein [Neorhodopirellula pilleata]|uniref:hypothetical protein n=1 Tax=Neorhodopirellula pilleata TaxID=2714738 RepID=UPI0011B36588|nr:hypothetical protein [Neorhodopirellula pilleata]